MNFKYFKIQSLIPLILILAVVLQPISDWIENQLATIDTIKAAVPYVDALSTIGMISIVLAFINYQGWKMWGLFKWLIDIPNLNGRYVGKLVSSYIDPVTNLLVEKDCVLEIKQTASSIHVYAYTGDLATGVTTSKSSTTSEQFIKQANGFFDLFYIFSNTPSTMATQLNNHDGTARFIYYPDTKTLDGSYYNQRMNFGTIVVKFEDKKLIGRLKR